MHPMGKHLPRLLGHLEAQDLWDHNKWRHLLTIILARNVGFMYIPER
jgi:hypothetical protein